MTVRVRIELMLLVRIVVRILLPIADVCQTVSKIRNFKFDPVVRSQLDR